VEGTGSLGTGSGVGLTSVASPDTSEAASEATSVGGAAATPGAGGVLIFTIVVAVISVIRTVVVAILSFLSLVTTTLASSSAAPSTTLAAPAASGRVAAGLRNCGSHDGATRLGKCTSGGATGLGKRTSGARTGLGKCTSGASTGFGLGKCTSGAGTGLGKCAPGARVARLRSWGSTAASPAASGARAARFGSWSGTTASRAASTTLSALATVPTCPGRRRIFFIVSAIATVIFLTRSALVVNVLDVEHRLAGGDERHIGFAFIATAALLVDGELHVTDYLVDNVTRVLETDGDVVFLSCSGHELDKVN
jgi:hypothetical protein